MGAADGADAEEKTRRSEVRAAIPKDLLSDSVASKIASSGLRFADLGLAFQRKDGENFAVSPSREG